MIAARCRRRGADAELLLRAGDVEQVEPDKVPDVGDLPAAA